MSQAPFQPFRFTALPRELQQRVAGQLLLPDLKHLSMSSKKVRVEMIPVLFAKVEAPQYGQVSCVPFPLSAVSAIRTFTFNLNIANRSSEAISGFREAQSAQMAMLPFLGSVQHLRLDITVFPSLNLDDLERELELDSVAIRAICASCPRAKLDVRLVDTRDNTSEIVLAILPSILIPLQGQAVDLLSLTGFYPDWEEPVQLQDDAAYQAFMQVMPTVQKLELPDLCTFGWHPTPMAMPHLRELELSFQAGQWEPHMAQIAFRGITALVNSCSNLEFLELDITLRDRSEDWLAGLQIEPFRCPSLNKVRLLSAALSVFGRAMRQVGTKRLDVTIQGSEDWPVVTELVQKGLLGLESLELEVEIGPGWWSAGAGHSYKSLREAATRAKISLSAAITQAKAIVPVEEIIDAVRCMAFELRTVYVQFGDLPFDAFQAYQNCTPIYLSSLTALTLDLAEGTGGRHPTAAGDAFAAFLRHISAPSLTYLYCGVRTPFPTSFFALARAIENGAFPALTAIGGAMQITKGCGDWGDITHARVKRAVMKACATRGIAGPKHWAPPSRREQT